MFDLISLNVKKKDESLHVHLHVKLVILESNELRYLYTKESSDAAKT